MIITQSINIAFTTTSSVAFRRPVQQTTVLDSTNINFLRQVMLSNDGIKVIRGNYSIQFPMNQIFAAAFAAYPSMSWAPVMATQPSASTTLITSSVATSTASLFVVATDEFGNDMTYQWYVSASYGSGFAVPVGKNYQNTSSANISASYSGSIGNRDQYLFFCTVTNPGGITSSSIATVTLT